MNDLHYEIFMDKKKKTKLTSVKNSEQIIFSYKMQLVETVHRELIDIPDGPFRSCCRVNGFFALLRTQK